MTPKVRVQERDALLDDLTVAPAPSRYATRAPSRYAGGGAEKRYAARPADRYRQASNRYAAVTASAASRYATPPADRGKRYAARYLTERRPQRKLVRTTILVLPPLRTQGQLIWVPGSEYDRCYEYEGDTLWCLGMVVDFDESAESMLYQDVYDPIDKARLIGDPVESVASTWHSDEFYLSDDCSFEDMIPVARKLRKELMDDPQVLVSQLEHFRLGEIGTWAGWDHTPMHSDIFAALEVSTIAGLGAAALDYGIWLFPEELGATGELLNQMIDEENQNWGIRCLPVDNFVVYEGSLNSNTVREQGWNGPHFQMRGAYAVVKVEYRSDLEGVVVMGWRSCYLEPSGTNPGRELKDPNGPLDSYHPGF